MVREEGKWIGPPKDEDHTLAPLPLLAGLCGASLRVGLPLRMMAEADDHGR